MPLITNNEILRAFCARLTEETFITLDTEFMREKSYWPLLCVAQVAGSKEAAVIDCLAPGIDLSPLWELLENPNILKVFHAARQDIEMFYYQTGKIPTPLFDTQVAAMVCGFGEQVSYANLVKKYAKASLDKSLRFTDWARRPLDERQIAYALADVTHLRVVYEKLQKILTKTERGSWLKEELEALASPELYKCSPSEAWKKLKYKPYTQEQMSLLVALSAWREEEAQKRNLPRTWILRDDVLIILATHGPARPKDFDHLRIIPKGFPTSKEGKVILEIIEKTLASDLSLFPPPITDSPSLEPRRGPLLEVLKMALRMLCEAQNVAPRLVASYSDLECLVGGDAEEISKLLLLHGWRYTLFGQYAMQLCRGELAIAVRNYRPILVPVTPE